MAPIATAAVLITSKEGFTSGHDARSHSRSCSPLWRPRCPAWPPGARSSQGSRGPSDSARRGRSSRFEEERLAPWPTSSMTRSRTPWSGSTRRPRRPLHLQAARTQSELRRPFRTSSAASPTRSRNSASTLKIASSLPTARLPCDQRRASPTCPSSSTACGERGSTSTCRLDVMPGGCSGAIAHGAYRIVQESLTNVLRHSNARRATVRVTLIGDDLLVEVLDDGHAAPSDPRTPVRGCGV